MALRAWRTIYDARRFSMALGMNYASAAKHFDRREPDGSVAGTKPCSEIEAETWPGGVFPGL